MMNKNFHNRRSIRLPHYDYSKPGAYFLTFCVENRDEQLFGNIVGATCGRPGMPQNHQQMVLNDFGKIVRDEWERSFQFRRELKMDEYVIMPNHFHAIVIIRDLCTGGLRVAHDAIAASPVSSGDPPVAPTKERPRGPKSKSIGSLIAGFKSVVTKRINQIRKTPGCPLWQRNYYEHIIRDEESFFAVRQYIRDNPANWDEDEENPLAKSPRYVAMPNAQRGTTMPVHFYS
jgi:REP element-mobilizing transposase RayT